MASYCFIVNPRAGRGKAGNFSRLLTRWLVQKDESHTVVYTDGPMHAAELARLHADSHDVVVAVGGDGTIHEVINGLVGKSTQLAIIPVGTGNDLVKVLGIPLNAKKAFENVFKPALVKSIDVGKANERYFINGLGIGFDALVVKKSKTVRMLRGNFVYLYAVLVTLWKYSYQTLNLAFNKSKREDDLFMLTIGNGPSLGGGFFLTPNARPDDGIFDLCMIRKMNKLHILKNLIKVYSGKHIYDPHVEMSTTKKITISAEMPFPAHVDGEILGYEIEKLIVELIPSAIKVRC